ncbi:MAG: SlyX family protein [Gammaproteobacteria bacterium]|nr:SlyX family protein [Gammaproteobacteria bacterium]
MPTKDDDGTLEFQFDRRFTDLEMRFAFQEQALNEMSDALAASSEEASRNHELLQRALEDLKQLRTLLYSDPANEPPPPHY